MYNTIVNMQMVMQLYILLGLLLGRFTHWEKSRLPIEHILVGSKNWSDLLEHKTLSPWRKPKRDSPLDKPVALSL